MAAEAPALRIGVLASHPIQYQAPIFRELARRCDLTVYFAQEQPPQAQASAGFGVAFDWDVDLLSGYAHEFLRNVAREPDTGRFRGCDTPAIRDRVVKGRFDAFVVLGWHLKCFWQAVSACRSAGVPVMCRGDSQLGTPRGAALRWAKAMLYPPLLRRFDAHLYVGARNREYLMHYGVPAGRLFFSPHCVDVPRFAAAAMHADAMALRESWGAPDAAGVLFAGKLVERKRPHDLIEALARLAGNGRHAMAVFAGDGPLRADLQSFARARGVKTLFLGFCNQSQLPAVYAAADLLVLPSAAQETWGLVVNEAMASGTPCVVSHACGCAPDMVEDRGTGIVYPCGDIGALAAAIDSVLRGRDMFRAALPAINDAYSPAVTARGIVDATRQLKRATPGQRASVPREGPECG
jgi:glycosyltransferase involved in cell wall biosynthesis